MGCRCNLVAWFRAARWPVTLSTVHKCSTRRGAPPCRWGGAGRARAGAKGRGSRRHTLWKKLFRARHETGWRVSESMLNGFRVRRKLIIRPGGNRLARSLARPPRSLSRCPCLFPPRVVGPSFRRWGGPPRRFIIHKVSDFRIRVTQYARGSFPVLREISPNFLRHPAPPT